MCVQCKKDKCNCELPKNESVSSNILYDGDNLACGNELVVKKNVSLSVVLKGLIAWLCTKLRVPVPGIVGGNVIYPANVYVSTAIENLTQIFNQYLQGGSGVTMVQLIDITYAELVILVNNATLIQGTFYRITDFRTIYDQPLFDDQKDPVTTEPAKQGPVQPLIVLALSNDTLSIQAYQEDYPLDVVEYKLSYTTPISSTSTKGRIIYRKDIDGNETDYDHRNILLRRYNDANTLPTSWYDLGLGSVEVLTFHPLGYHRNNKILGFANNMDNHNYFFDIPNITFEVESHNNVFSDNCYNNVFTGVMTDNIFKGNCFNNVLICDATRGNVITNMAQNYIEIVSGSMYYNNIYESFTVNHVVFTGSFQGNDFHNFYQNNISGQCTMTRNKIYQFSYNDVTGGSSISLNEMYRLHQNDFDNATLFQVKSNGNFGSNQLLGGGFNACQFYNFDNCIVTDAVIEFNTSVNISSQDFSLSTIMYLDCSKEIIRLEDGVDVLKYHDQYGALITTTDLTL